MNLSEVFSDKVSSRVVAYAFAAAAVLGLEGCAGGTQNIMRGAANQVVNQQSYQLRKGMADSLSHTTKCAIGVVAAGCGNNNATMDQLGTQRRYNPQLGY